MPLLSSLPAGSNQLQHQRADLGYRILLLEECKEMLVVTSGRIIDQFFSGHLGDSNLHVTVDANSDSGFPHAAVESALYAPLSALSRIHLSRTWNRTVEAENICITHAPRASYAPCGRSRKPLTRRVF